jgi:hypothetical protein
MPRPRLPAILATTIAFAAPAAGLAPAAGAASSVLSPTPPVTLPDGPATAPTSPPPTPPETPAPGTSAGTGTSAGRIPRTGIDVALEAMVAGVVLALGLILRVVRPAGPRRKRRAAAARAAAARAAAARAAAARAARA